MQHKDIIIVGAGPAGLKAGQEAKRLGLNYIILEKEKIGDSWKKIRPGMKMLSACLPQRDWTSLSEKFPIWKLPVERPFCTVSEFVNYLKAFADHFKLDIAENSQITSLLYSDKIYRVRCASSQEYTAPILLIATGVIGNPYIPELPGVENNPIVSHSFFYQNSADYKQQRVLIIGSGNSAAEIAIELTSHAMVYLVSRREMRFFSDTKELHHIRGVSESYLRELIAMDVIRHFSPDQLIKIEDNKAFFNKHQIEVDQIIFATGYKPFISLLDENFKLSLDKKGYPVISDGNESVDYENLYFGGPLANQNSSSPFIHGFVKQIIPMLEHIAAKIHKNQ